MLQFVGVVNHSNVAYLARHPDQEMPQFKIGTVQRGVHTLRDPLTLIVVGRPKQFECQYGNGQHYRKRDNRKNEEMDEGGRTVEPMAPLPIGEATHACNRRETNRDDK